jgi:hypothetical protein
MFVVTVISGIPTEKSRNADSVRIRNASEKDAGINVTKQEVYNVNGICLF